jgi:hypothetical protein
MAMYFVLTPKTPSQQQQHNRNSDVGLDGGTKTATTGGGAISNTPRTESDLIIDELCLELNAEKIRPSFQVGGV